MPTNEMRVIGPPGCGKTTRLTKYVEEAVGRYGADNVLVTSLTKSAAREVAGRNSVLDDDRIGTLHAHAYRALGRPSLAEDRKALQHWNDVHEDSVHLQLTVEGLDAEDSTPESGQRFAYPADADFAEYKRLRSQMTPRAIWPRAVQEFGEEWDKFKADNDLRDFNDLMDDARGVLSAPGSPKVILVDEAQDHDRQQFALLRHWAEQVEALIVVGDPDQNLYEWRGSEPEAWTPPCPEHWEGSIAPAQVKSSPTCTCVKTLVLEQSYRVPRAVHHQAVSWIERTAGREPISYRPTDEEGEVREALSLRFMDSPWRLVDHAQRDLDAGKSVMFLASCAYMVGPLVKFLRDEGIPFWNPWRLKNGQWNPMRRGTAKTVTGLDRVTAYYGPDLDGGRLYWTGAELKKWLLATSKMLRRGAKEKIKELHDDHLVSGEEFDALFLDDEMVQEAWNLSTIPDRIMSAYRAGWQYPWQMARQHGPEILTKQPQIIVGTIHSVKGAEADTVYLAPDLSMAGAEEWNTLRGEAAIRRLFYVGMTRARERLVLCGGRGVPWCHSRYLAGRRSR